MSLLTLGLPSAISSSDPIANLYKRLNPGFNISPRTVLTNAVRERQAAQDQVAEQTENIEESQIAVKEAETKDDNAKIFAARQLETSIKNEAAARDRLSRAEAAEARAREIIARVEEAGAAAEDPFQSYMRKISEIDDMIEQNMRRDKQMIKKREREGDESPELREIKGILDFLGFGVVNVKEAVPKDMIFPLPNSEPIEFTSIILTTTIDDRELIIKTFNLDKKDNTRFERAKCMFNNEIYCQLKAYELMESMPSLSLIVPRIDTEQLYVFKNECIFILGMEYINGMVPIVDILTPENYLEIYTKIKDIILALNSIGIYHNDLNNNNIQAKIAEDRSIKIVLIDFGEARNVAAIDGPPNFQPRGSVYFDQKNVGPNMMYIPKNERHLFRGADGNYLPDPGIVKMREWARPIHRGGKLKKRRQNYNKNYNKNKSKKIIHGKKSKKRTKGKKSKTSKKKNKTKNKKSKKIS
jgi:hypothetical protein